tara:strand:- start:17786 stop:18646 length:861 start_codon:yes stop_codon:yes gene_type:complete
MKMISSLELLPKYEAESSWWEHVPLAHMLVEILRPETIVELGTHYGVSLFSFCEAAENYSKGTYVYAVDTWSGDEQAGYYGDEVYRKVSEHREKYHKERCQLIKSTFDDAAKRFEDKSIDIIHIDGLHTYEAVKADYDTWKNKVREGGSILFHDWNVREGDFGVWKLWESIKQDEEYKCIEFPNGYGLGIATACKVKPDWHRIIEENMRTLQCKGILLERINNAKRQIKHSESESMIREKHITNLEKITEDQRESIKIYESKLRKKNNWMNRIYQKGKRIIERMKG